jgi:hypothetical protein
MAITIGTAASIGAYPLNPVSVSHTLGSSTNRAVIAFFCLHGATSYTITQAKYNNVNMVLAGSGICPALYSRAIAIYAYYLLEANLPAAGTYTCTFQSSAGYAGGLLVLDLAGVVQSAPSYTATGNSRNPDLTGAYNYTINAAASTTLILDATSTEINNTNTPDAGQTDVFGTVNETGSTYCWGSRKFASGAGSQTMGWTPGGQYSHYEQLLLAIDAYATPAPPGNPALDNACFMSGF